MSSDAHPLEPALSARQIAKAKERCGRICFFGTGILLRKCYRQLVLALGREPDFLCDNDSEKWGGTFHGRTCLSPDELSEMADSTLVVVTIRNFERVVDQLNTMGVRDILVACFDAADYGLTSIRAPDAFAQTPRASERVDMKDLWTLVTGASRGIGRLIALEMAKLGSNVVVHSRSQETTIGVKKNCSELGAECISVAADFDDLKAVDAILDDVHIRVPRIDVVFNNAAMNVYREDLWAVGGEDLLKCFRTNTVAPLRICYRLIPQMLERGFGRIINISTGIEGKPEEMAYACSKAALNKFVYDMAPKLNGTNVAISLVNPGWVRTDLGGEHAHHSAESVIPGALLGALLDGTCNGRWIIAQDYSGMELDAALLKARRLLAR